MTPTLGPKGLAALALPALLTLGAVAVPAAQSGATPVASSMTDRAPRPNVVLVMADDLGWSDLSTGRTNGGTGSDFVETPAIDRLADEGTAFDNAYAATNCAPTRAALLTGLYAPRPGNNVYEVDDLNRGGADTMLVGPPQGLPDGDDALPQDTITRRGDAAGCRLRAPATSASSTSPDVPADIVQTHGFDENLGGTAAGHAWRVPRRERGVRRQRRAGAGQVRRRLHPGVRRHEPQAVGARAWATPSSTSSWAPTSTSPTPWPMRRSTTSTATPTSRS